MVQPCPYLRMLWPRLAGQTRFNMDGVRGVLRSLASKPSEGRSVRCLAAGAYEAANLEPEPVGDIDEPGKETTRKDRLTQEFHKLMTYSSQSSTVSSHHSPCGHGYSFNMPASSLIGSNSLPQSAALITRLGFKKALVITDKYLSARGSIGPVINILSTNYIDYYIFDGISPNPTVHEVETGLKVLNEQGCDFIISYGGGSPHDAAKAISLVGALK